VRPYQRTYNQADPRAAKMDSVPIWAFGIRQMPKSAPKRTIVRKHLSLNARLVRMAQNSQKGSGNNA